MQLTTMLTTIKLKLIIWGLVLLSWFGLGLYIHALKASNKRLEQRYSNYVQSVKLESEKSQAAFNAKLSLVSQQYEDKIKQLNESNLVLSNRAERMSVALKATQSNYAKASLKDQIEYTNALNVISGQCIAEYTKMARIADEHKAREEYYRDACS